MERDIDLDAAMIRHLESLGYSIKHPNHKRTMETSDAVPALFKRCMERNREAGEQYEDAWDYLSNVGLSEIIMMKAARMRAAIDKDFDESAIDSLVDLCNYSTKLYSLLNGEVADDAE